MEERIKELIEEMSLEEKASLLFRLNHLSKGYIKEEQVKEILKEYDKIM